MFTEICRLPALNIYINNLIISEVVTVEPVEIVENSKNRLTRLIFSVYQDYFTC